MSFLNNDDMELKESTPKKNELVIDNYSDKIFQNIKGVFSAIFSGAKGTSKSTSAYSINDGEGIFIILDFDGNSKRVINLVVDPSQIKNYKIFNIKKMIDYTKLEDVLKLPAQAYKVYLKVEKIIYEKIADLKPNFIIFDGFQRWVWICEMAMRSVHMRGKNPFTDGGDWNMWKERNFYVDRSFQGAKQIATDAVLFTVHEIEKEKTIKDPNDPKGKKYIKMAYTMPTWLSTVKEEIDIVIESSNSSLGIGGTNVYKQNVKSNKVTGIEKSIDVTKNPGKIWEQILYEKIEPLIKKKKT